MNNLIYFHIEKKENGKLNLVSNAYKDDELQLENNGSVKNSDYREFTSIDDVSEGLLRTAYKKVYGSPMGNHSKCTILEISETAAIKFGELDMAKLRVTKDKKVKKVMSVVRQTISEDIRANNKVSTYRVVLEIKN